MNAVSSRWYSIAYARASALVGMYGPAWDCSYRSAAAIRLRSRYASRISFAILHLVWTFVAERARAGLPLTLFMLARFTGAARCLKQDARCLSTRPDLILPV